MFVSIYAFRGDIDEHKVAEMNKQIAIIAKMRYDGFHCAVWHFPAYPDGTPPENLGGGVGFTYVQPIISSFLSWDTWSELWGGYVFIVSCLEFNHNELLEYLKTQFHKVEGIKVYDLRLPYMEGIGPKHV